MDTHLLESPAPTLGPAMQVILALAAQRWRDRAIGAGAAIRDTEPHAARMTLLWELAERFHPEEVWLAESHVRGERTFDELVRIAPRGALAPSVGGPPGHMVVSRASARRGRDAKPTVVHTGSRTMDSV